MMDIEVIILQHNLSELTVKCIESVRAQRDCGIYLTVVDQASNLQHREAVMDLADKYIGNVENQPIHQVWNELIPASKSDLVALVNNDTYLANTCLSRLEETLNQNPKVAWISGVSQPYAGWGHCMINWPPEVLRDWERNPAVLNDWALSLKPSVRFWDRIETTVFIIRKEVIGSVGLFDYQNLGSHFQELDYGIRLNDCGWISAVRYDAVYWHWIHKTVPEAIADNTWNSIDVPQSKQYLEHKYPGIDVYALKELQCE